MSERYDAIMAMKPEDRVESSGDVLRDRIAGILVGFGQRFQDSKYWMDENTIRDAEKEIRSMLKDVKNGQYEDNLK